MPNGMPDLIFEVRQIVLERICPNKKGPHCYEPCFADRTGLERVGVYASDTMSWEGDGFGATELRSGERAWGRYGI